MRLRSEQERTGPVRVLFDFVDHVPTRSTGFVPVEVVCATATVDADSAAVTAYADENFMIDLLWMNERRVIVVAMMM